MLLKIDKKQKFLSNKPLDSIGINSISIFPFIKWLILSFSEEKVAPSINVKIDDEIELMQKMRNSL